MAEQTVVCPKCGSKIPLSKALGGQLEQRIRKELTSELKERERELKAQYAAQIASVTKDAERAARKKVAAELRSDASRPQ